MSSTRLIEPRLNARAGQGSSADVETGTGTRRFAEMTISSTRQLAAGDGPHLVLYDGECGLCNAWVRFVLQRDTAGAFHFASLQGDIGREHLARLGVSAAPRSTICVMTAYGSVDATCLTKSDAVLFVLETLGWPWRAATVLRTLPLAWLDAGYDFVARHRHQLWRRAGDNCLMPSPQHRARILDLDAARGTGTSQP